MNRTKRDNANGKYYVISNLLQRNLKTGNFCVNFKQLVAQDKDFLFDFTDQETGEVERKVLDKRYVLEHCRPLFKWEYSALTMQNELKGMFYLISYQDILNADDLEEAA